MTEEIIEDRRHMVFEPLIRLLGSICFMGYGTAELQLPPEAFARLSRECSTRPASAFIWPGIRVTRRKLPPDDENIHLAAPDEVKP